MPFRPTATVVALACALAACAPAPTGAPSADAAHYGLDETAEILLTSEAGAALAQMPNVAFHDGTAAEGVRIVVRPDEKKQTLLGIGTSFTESSAFVLAHLPPEVRAEVMDRIYGADGADFTLARTPIGSTDFSVEGHYNYAETPGDTALASFSIDVDRDGFRAADYPGIRDQAFDLLPMIHEALAIKARDGGTPLRIVASAWTAPPWMKDIETYHIPGSEANGWQGTGGSLKPEHVPTYADYLTRYLSAYQAAGVDIWGLTPVNEPLGNSGQWESMHFTAESQRDFVADHLGPALAASGHGDVKLLVYDQNREHLEHWANVILSDPEAAQYVYGSAIHWYSSTYKVHEDVLQRVHEAFPDFAIVHTEGTIDDLGKPAGDGIRDPERFTETGWFGNDAFWWNETATDWAYSAEWAPNVEDHPVYTPVHRYARNIIVSLDHWVEGWIDWNIVLDADGGPNHVGNLCGAPIMIDTATGEVYYTPIFNVLAQFSRTIRPGDRAVQTETHRADLGDDALHASASLSPDGLLSVQVLNTTKQPVTYQLQIGAQVADVEIAANAVQTVRVQL